MNDFVKNLLPKDLDKNETIKVLNSKLDEFYVELAKLENYRPESFSDEEEEKIEGKLHSLNLKVRYIKETLKELENE